MTGTRITSHARRTRRDTNQTWIKMSRKTPTASSASAVWGTGFCPASRDPARRGAQKDRNVGSRIHLQSAAHLGLHGARPRLTAHGHQSAAFVRKTFSLNSAHIDFDHERMWNADGFRRFIRPKG